MTRALSVKDPNTLYIRKEIQLRLDKAGFFVVTSRNMENWMALLDASGQFVNPLFNPAVSGARGAGNITIFRKDGSMASTIAWREQEVDDYTQLMKDGAAWTSDARALGWRAPDLSALPRLGGLIHSRGNLFSAVKRPEEKGNSLSWFITTLHWCEAWDQAADYVVSHAQGWKIDKNMHRAYFGYRHAELIPETDWIWFGERCQAYLVWSDAGEIGEDLMRKERILRQSHGQDLRTTVRSFQRYQQAVESARPVGANAVHEAKVRSA